MTTQTPTRSQQLFERAYAVMPGGVNSPVRSCNAVGAEPVFIERADGAYLFDIDGNRYIDYVGSWGPMISGHRHPRILRAIEDALHKGTSFGAPCKWEVELAELICDLVPSVEMVRMVNSGTEATMSAIRLARAFTNRSLLVKFNGCYHGHADSFLVKAGSGIATLGISSSSGTPAELTKLTLSLPFNDVHVLEEAFEAHKDKIAAVIVEPVIGNCGLVLPDDGYLASLRELCTKNGALLIFDEVMTGFRIALGGAQARYGIKPDLTCLGKIIGGGLPIGAYGGRKNIMEMIAPKGPVYQAGTFSGNPMAMAAGLAQLKMLQSGDVYQVLDDNTQTLARGLKQIIEKAGVQAYVTSITGMLSVIFSCLPVCDSASAQACDTALFAKLWRRLMECGIYWPPSQFEIAFISQVHSKQNIEETLEAFADGVSQLSLL